MSWEIALGWDSGLHVVFIALVLLCQDESVQVCAQTVFPYSRSGPGLLIFLPLLLGNAVAVNEEEHDFFPLPYSGLWFWSVTWEE